VTAKAKKILLVEDDIDCRNILAVIITHLGYQVVQAAAGRNSLKKAKYEHPDLIVVSLDYPYLKGIKAISRFKNDSATTDLPILVYPPWNSESAAELALSAGATEVLTEPFSVNAIHAALQRYAPLDSELFGKDVAVIPLALAWSPLEVFSEVEG
jgi:DNA-binding response OmpR family regulator